MKMAKLQLTADVKALVQKETKNSPRFVYNDRRKTFQRRYKLQGVGSVTAKQATRISAGLNAKYPELQFVVENLKDDRRMYRIGGKYQFGSVTVKVFDLKA